MSQHRTKLLLVEDNPEYRKAISLALEHIEEFELLARFGTAEQALRRIQEDKTLSQADVMLLDLNLPKISGLDALEWIRQYSPNLKIIVLTQSDDRDDVITAIKRGANGYLLKSSNITQIKDAINTVMEGGAPIDSKIATYFLEQVKQMPMKAEDEHFLTDRELDVLKLLSEGLIKKEIADRLNISSHTVATHVRNTYEKLGVLNAPAAVTAAYKSGILPRE